MCSLARKKASVEGENTYYSRSSSLASIKAGTLVYKTGTYIYHWPEGKAPRAIPPEDDG